MGRVLAVLLLFFAIAAQLSAQRGSLDPAFEKIPFDQWSGQPDKGQFHWTVKIPRAELSFHQRLVSSVDLTLDGQDLDKRRKDGEVTILIQITGSDGARYQDHGTLDLSKLDVDAKNANLEYSQRAFFVPGDYQVAVALVDQTTGDHSVQTLQAHIPTPAHEWLTDAWSGLPAVEYIGDDASPESWFLPYIHGRLLWASDIHAPVRLNVVMNVTPSRHGSGDLAALLPSLKVISHTGSAALSEHVALLDISRHHTVFEQDEVQDLDWPRLKTSLKEASTASIDIHSLGERHEDAQYFVSEIRRLLRASGEKPCALVVLTTPVEFDSGEDREPISLEALPPCRVIYIRYHTPRVIRPFNPQMGMRGRRSRMGGGGPMMGEPGRQEPLDQLESTMKPLSPKVIDVETPPEVTKALAEIAKVLEATAEGRPDHGKSRR